jgi:hypothetical protein
MLSFEGTPLILLGSQGLSSFVINPFRDWRTFLKNAGNLNAKGVGLAYVIGEPVQTFNTCVYHIQLTIKRLFIGAYVEDKQS